MENPKFNIEMLFLLDYGTICLRQLAITFLLSLIYVDLIVLVANVILIDCN